MCGIVGYVGPRDAAPILIEGLRRLEYRGYDSAGIAIRTDDGRVFIEKKAGKLTNLTDHLNGDSPPGHPGIGHTRWATHGPPNDANAHPHTDCTGKLALIHNGIIENYAEIKVRLAAEGHRFSSDTDTEVLAHLIETKYPAISSRPSGSRSSRCAARTPSASCTPTTRTGSSERG